MLEPGHEQIEDDVILEWEKTLENPAERRDVLKSGLVSDLFDKDILAHLEHVFHSTGLASNALSANDFRALMSNYIPAGLVETIYRAIDVNDVGYVNYSDFTNYLIASEAGSRFSSQTYAARFVMATQQEEDAAAMHRDMIDNLVYIRRPVPVLVTGGRDGQVSLWDPEELRLIAQIHHKDKNSVYKAQLASSMDKKARAQCFRNLSSLNQGSSSSSSSSASSTTSKVPITSLTGFLGTAMICVGSADASVTIYELGTQDAIGRYDKLDSVPTALESFSRLKVYQGGGGMSNKSDSYNESGNAGTTTTTTVAATATNTGTAVIGISVAPMPSTVTSAGSTMFASTASSSNNNNNSINSNDNNNNNSKVLTAG